MAEVPEKKETSMVSGDSGPGTAIADILPIPVDMQPVTDPLKTEVAHSMAEEPSLSHALAKEEQEIKGRAQEDHDHEVLDLGWNEQKQDIEAPLVGGMDNEELWLLVRRFNMQIWHVKSMPRPPPGGLDLNIADDEEFSPDKLRAYLERLYMTFIVNILGAGKHIARLRSWREWRRTTAFAVAYFIAWVLDLIVPLLTGTIILLIVYPESRGVLFPPAPLALVNTKTGGVQKPKAGVLGSHDSATGAPQNHKGEAVEQEASNFVSGLASVALSSATGKNPQEQIGNPDEDPSNVAPDPTSVAVKASDARDVAAGSKPGGKHDKTKVPMEAAMWNKMRPIMHGLAYFADTWERFGNALSPTPPFPRNTPRLRLAALVLPLFLLSFFITNYILMKSITFGIGFGFFGDPIIMRGVHYLNEKVPNWQKLLEPRNTILKGVPTNAQITVTLLRLGEANHAPLPPPPRITEGPPDKPAEVTDEHLRATGAEPPLNATKAELDKAIEHDPHVANETTGRDISASKNSHHGKKGSKILGFFRGLTGGAVRTALTTDTLRAKITGSGAAKERLGVVPPAHYDRKSGPVEFKARWKGKRGHVFITAKATIPAVAFSTDETVEKIGPDGEKRVDLHPQWSVAVADIVELKKFGGFSWKTKLVVGWALEREVKDGLEIVTSTGDSYRVTAMPMRDELFNRLVAMGGQKWEAW